MTTRTVTKCPTLLGKRVRMNSYGAYCWQFGELRAIIYQRDPELGSDFYAGVADSAGHFKTLAQAVRWAERRILATARALDKARGK